MSKRVKVRVSDAERRRRQKHANIEIALASLAKKGERLIAREKLLASLMPAEEFGKRDLVETHGISPYTARHWIRELDDAGLLAHRRRLDGKNWKLL